MTLRQEADKWASLYFQHVAYCGGCVEQHPACREGARLSRLLDRAGLEYARVAVGGAS